MTIQSYCISVSLQEYNDRQRSFYALYYIYNGLAQKKETDVTEGRGMWGYRGSLLQGKCFKCVDYVNERAFKLPHIHPLENANNSVTLCSRGAQTFWLMQHHSAMF
jgi:hypothetical protein